MILPLAYSLACVGTLGNRRRRGRPVERFVNDYSCSDVEWMPREGRTAYTTTAAKTLPATALPSLGSLVEPVMLWWFACSPGSAVSRDP